MSLDGQAACGVEFPVHISVEKALGFLADHKQFSGASKCGKTVSLKAVNGFWSVNRSPSPVRIIVVNRTRHSFISAPASYLVATSDHAHGSIGNPRAARRSDQECEVRFIDARQREGPKVASEAGISLRTKWHQRRVHQCGIPVCSAG